MSFEIVGYSRWLDSKFYTYWHNTVDFVNKEDEIFACHTQLWRSHNITYSECKIYSENILKLKGRMNEIDDDEDAIEIQGYMKQFMTDVDEEYDYAKS
jgi:hypothetical protein